MHIIIKRDRAALEHRRREAGKLFHEGISQACVAQRLGVSPAAACKWYAQWRQAGQDGLRSQGPPGAAPKLAQRQRERLKQIIEQGPLQAGYATDFWTLARIRAVARKRLGIELGIGTVWRTVTALGFSCQKPERRAKERDEKAIRDWQLSAFPKLKKMG
jgi:transposase